MSAYRIDIDGRIYEGQYSNKANAVFGAMTKDLFYNPELEPAVSYPDDGWQQAGKEISSFRNARFAEGNLIAVEQIVGRKVPVKVHRVNP